MTIFDRFHEVNAAEWIVYEAVYAYGEARHADWPVRKLIHLRTTTKKPKLAKRLLLGRAGIIHFKERTDA